MEKQKLYQLLPTLTPSERGRLRKFVASPYFNSDAELLKLLDLLEAGLTADPPVLPPPEEVHARLFPGQSYSGKRLNYRTSALNLLTERFLAQEHLSRQRPEAFDLALLDELSSRELRKSFVATQRRLERRLDAPAGETTEQHFYRARLADILDQDHIRRRQRTSDDSLERAASELDRYYLLRRLNYSCSLLDRAHIVGGEVEAGLSEDWLRHFRRHVVPGSLLGELYLKAYGALVDTEEESYFHQLRDFLLDYDADQPTEELTVIFQLAINYAVRKTRGGQTAYVREAFELYRRGIATGALLREGVLSHWTFTNVVKLALRLKRYTDAEAFISTYAGALPEPFRDNAVNYALAELYYATERMEPARERLTQVAYTDPSFYLGARILLAKIYYETGAEDALVSLLAAFTVFLQRDEKLGRNLKLSCRNFCLLLSRILRRRPGREAALREAIATTQPLTEREWLLALVEKG